MVPVNSFFVTGKSFLFGYIGTQIHRRIIMVVKGHTIVSKKNACKSLGMFLLLKSLLRGGRQLFETT
jgi:hypothetical protein